MFLILVQFLPLFWHIKFPETEKVSYDCISVPSTRNLPIPQVRVYVGVWKTKWPRALHLEKYRIILLAFTC